MARESVLLETDAVDSAGAEAPWWGLAQQLKQDLASVILMSEAELQVPTSILRFTNSKLSCLTACTRNWKSTVLSVF